MKTLNWLLPLLLLLTLTNCEKSTVECCVSSDQFTEFIFGTYYGECMGETCIETFKLENGTLFEDGKDSYGGPFPYPGEWTALSTEKYDLAKDLPASFPNALFDESETTLGIPDAGDWGGIYLEVLTDKGNRFHWNIDTMKDNVPAYLRDFVDELMGVVEQIKD